MFGFRLQRRNNMDKNALKNIVEIMKGGYIRDVRFKTAFLDVLTQKANPNLAALCECIINSIEKNKK